MKNIDLITLLSKLPPNAEVKFEYTTKRTWTNDGYPYEEDEISHLKVKDIDFEKLDKDGNLIEPHIILRGNVYED